MAGHSKWANIQHRKGRQDEKRGRVWTKIIREITVAARTSGGDLNTNPHLRLAVDKARDANIPADTIKRNIDKATGSLEGLVYEAVRYEGYGVGGAAVMVDTLTDNRIRTVAEVRHAFSKNGGNLGSEGSVAYQFTHCGWLMFAPGADYDALLELALGAGADDVLHNADDSIEMLIRPADFEGLLQAVKTQGLVPALKEITYRPTVSVELSEEDTPLIRKLLDALEDLDDVQAVYHNADW
ncbi:MAG: YebC/PmpR family DNA-binding transcriptional regulator [Gammaproteobacteria bacterium]|nr:YebC/PmpR family DNA-binding transcriptional regulator [Gammaproteobacteria bacterium]